MKAVVTNINPFTAAACKISELKYTWMHLQTQYIFHSCDTSAYNAVRFDENHFTCQCKKRKQNCLKVSNFALLMVVFKWHHCSEGVKSPFAGNKNRLQQKELIATAVDNFCLWADLCNGGAIGYLLWTPLPYFCCKKNDKTCFCILIFCHRNTKMKKAKDMFRIRVNILMALTTIVLCMVYMSSGKKAQERGESVIQMNRDRHFEFQQQK